MRYLESMCGGRVYSGRHARIQVLEHAVTNSEELWSIRVGSLLIVTLSGSGELLHEAGILALQPGD